MSRPTPNSAVTFGIMTATQQVSYRDILRVWREADTIPEIEHAWLSTGWLYPSDRNNVARSYITPESPATALASR